MENVLESSHVWLGAPAENKEVCLKLDLFGFERIDAKRFAYYNHEITMVCYKRKKKLKLPHSEVE